MDKIYSPKPIHKNISPLLFEEDNITEIYTGILLKNNVINRSQSLITNENDKINIKLNKIINYGRGITKKYSYLLYFKTFILYLKKINSNNSNNLQFYKVDNQKYYNYINNKFDKYNIKSIDKNKYIIHNVIHNVIKR